MFTFIITVTFRRRVTVIAVGACGHIRLIYLWRLIVRVQVALSLSHTIKWANQTMLTVFFFPLVLASICSFEVVGKAFCDENLQRISYFPLENPERHVPWVWDSFYNTDKHVVEIVSIPRQACHFNTTTWQRFASQFPQYAPQLGDGLFSNVLVSVDSLKM
jgi:hypothetical protein